MKKAIDFLKTLNCRDKYIVLGCSGGPDSMCLLNILYEEKYKVVCCHINHNIREESLNEYLMLEEYCKKNNIIFEGLTLPKNSMDEAYYRNKRYSYYKEIADKYSTSYIMTAHHGDDLIETILMRITRGSNLKGYSGFSKCYNENGYTYIKPLIYYTKDEIIKYNKENNIAYFEDKTNSLDLYTRNRYRHKMLPFLKLENKSVHKKYLDFSEELLQATNYLDRITTQNLIDNYKDGSLDLSKFEKLDEYVKKLELEKIFSLLYKDDIKSITSIHIKEILKLLCKKQNFKYSLPNGLICEREYNYLFFNKNKILESFNLILNDSLIIPNGDIIRKTNKEGKSNYYIKLSLEEIKLPIHVRNKKNGDSIKIKNLGGNKKIKDIFINEKIPKNYRKSWPVVTDDNDNIIWLPGLRKSEFDTTNRKKYDIILEYIRKEEINEKK